MFNRDSNPVGEVHTIEEIQKKIQFYCELWDSQKNAKSFWKFKSSLSAVTNFLLMALDDLVITVSTYLISGPDKKATVLSAIETLYDYTVREALPIWMRPFAAPVKHYIIYVLISSTIDWMVAKYRNGSWKSAQSALDRVLILADHRMVMCKSSHTRRRR